MTMKKQFIAILMMLAVMLSACSYKEMPVLDGNYYIESFHDEKIVFQSVDTHKKVEALLEDQTMFYTLVSESEITLQVRCSYEELQDNWEEDDIYYIIFYENESNRRCVSILREYTDNSGHIYEYLEETYLGQKLFKAKKNEGEMDLIPVEMVSVDNEAYLTELVQKGVLQEWDLNGYKVTGIPFIEVEYHEQSLKAKITSNTRYYILSTTGAERCSEEEMSQYFLKDYSLYRIILNGNEIECMMLYDYF